MPEKSFWLSAAKAAARCAGPNSKLSIRTTAARAALVFTLEAPFAALFGVLLADEVLGWAGWLGCGVMMAGILIAEPAAAATLRRFSRRRTAQA